MANSDQSNEQHNYGLNSVATAGCLFPDHKPYTGYSYGCRCARCKAGKALYMRQSNGNAREGGVAITKRRYDRERKTRWMPSR